MAASQGFHPKPRMTFPLALALGIEGCDEVMEVELTESLPATALMERLGPQTPQGLRIVSAEMLSPDARKARVANVEYQLDLAGNRGQSPFAGTARRVLRTNGDCPPLPLPPARRQEVEESVARLWAADTYPWQRPRRAAAIDLRASLLALELRGDVLAMRLSTAADGSAGPRDVLAALGLGDLEAQGARLVRTAVEVAP